MKRQRDKFHLRAKKLGIRSRAYFKLEDIDKRFNIFKQGDYVIDLGAYPGGWLQYISGKVGVDGKVIGVDVVPIEPIKGAFNVYLITEDIFNDEALSKIRAILEDRRADVIVSDLSPKLTGISELDSEKMLEYNMAVLKYVREFLRRGGKLVMKTFESRSTAKVIKALKESFVIVKKYKPVASRKTSAEVYLICINYKLR